MAAAISPSAIKVGSAHEGQQSYWTRTSPSSLSHVLRSPHHAAIAVLGVASFGSFSYGLIVQKPLDASLSGLLVLLCLYIYTLQSEHCRRKSELQENLVDLSVSPGDKKVRSGAAADGISELDLTGYAKTLGVSMRSGIVHKEGGTLNKILMDALAKEYLRCVSALRCYQEAFGPMGDDGPSQDSITPRVSATKPDPLAESLSKLVMDLPILDGQPALTPRSPAGLGGPPSPEPKRCRAHSGCAAPLEAADTSPLPAAPANTPANGLGENGGASGSSINVTGTTTRSEEEDESPVWRLDEVNAANFNLSESTPAEPEVRAEPVTFGLFGSSRRSGQMEKL